MSEFIEHSRYGSGKIIGKHLDGFYLDIEFCTGLRKKVRFDEIEYVNSQIKNSEPETFKPLPQPSFELQSVISEAV